MPITPIVYVVDVGQGSCNIITLGPSPIKGDDGLPAGLRAIIIDCGPCSPGTPALLLRERNITWVDALVITHNDRDHCGGLKKIVSYMGGAIDRAFYTCDRLPAEDDIVTTLEGFCKPNKLGIRQIRNPPKLLARFDDPLHVFPDKGKRLKDTDAKLFALSPFGNSSMLVARSTDPNEASAVLLLSANGQNVLFPGDATIANWRDLLDVRSNERIKASAIIVPHHGGRIHSNVADLEWLYREAISVDYGVVSAGTDNDDDHPRPDVLAELYHNSVRVVCTELTPNCSNCTTDQLAKKSHRKSKTHLESHSAASNNKKIPCSGTIEFHVKDGKLEFAPPTNGAKEESWLETQRKKCPLLVMKKKA